MLEKESPALRLARIELSHYIGFQSAAHRICGEMNEMASKAKAGGTEPTFAEAMDAVKKMVADAENERKEQKRICEETK